MRIAVIGDCGQPVAAPFAGGLEAMTWYLSTWFARRGHSVTLFAAPGSAVPQVEVEELDLSWHPSDAARQDVSMPDERVMLAHHAYLSAFSVLGARAHEFDVVHIHALHPLAIALAHTTGVPAVLTLHSPPTPWIESALRAAGSRAPHLVAVSAANQRRWAVGGHIADVISNGVDLDRWRPGSGSDNAAVWAGRIVPEKAPHLAIGAARRAGMALRLAGPIADPGYFAEQVAPGLGDGIDYVGCLDHAELGGLVGRSRVLLQTPQWDEPFCLSAAEAIACGTPVAAFARGGLAEVVGRHGGRLAEPGNVVSLAAAAELAGRLPRTLVRRHAERTLCLERTGHAYLDLFASLRSGSRRRRLHALPDAAIAPDETAVTVLRPGIALGADR